MLVHRSLRVLLVSLLAPLLAAPSCRSVTEPSPEGASRRALRRLAIPVTFEPGSDARDGDVQYLHRAPWGVVELRAERLAVELRGAVPLGGDSGAQDEWGDAVEAMPVERTVDLVPVRGTLAGARGLDELEARAHVYDGAHPAEVRTDLPLYGRVHVEDVWPQVSFELGAERGLLAFRIGVAADAPLEQVEWEVRGAEEVRVDEQGALRARVEHGELVLAPPRFRALDGLSRSRRLAGAYRLAGTRFGFTCEPRMPGERLEIDPIIQFASLSENLNWHSYLAVDGDAVVYHCQVSPALYWNEPEPDVVVHALDVSDLDAPVLLFQTALEGVLYPADLKAGHGRVLLGGYASALTLPAVGGGFQTEGVEGLFRMMLLSLDAAGGAVEHATYLGEPDQVPGYRVRYRLQGLDLVEDDGAVVIGAGGAIEIIKTGPEGAPEFPTSYRGPGDASPTTFGGATDDACFATFSSDLSTLESLRFAGGGHRDWLSFVEAVPGGFVGLGWSLSTDFPTTPGAFQQELDAGYELVAGDVPAEDMCVLRWDASGELMWSTLLGGPGFDGPNMLATSEDGEVGVGMAWPWVEGMGTARLTADGATLVHAQHHLGEVDIATNGHWGYGMGDLLGPGGEMALLVELPGDSGVTVSPEAFDPVQQGTEIYYAHLETSGGISYSSFLGGASHELAHDLAVGTDGGVWICGETISNDFPATVGAMPGGTPGVNQFLVKIAGDAYDASLEKSDDEDPVLTNSLVYFTVLLTNEGDEPIPPTALVDDLPAGWELALLQPGWTDDGGSVTIPVPALLPGQSFAVTVAAEAPPVPGTYANLVSWTSEGLVHAQVTEHTTVLDPGDVPELVVTIDGPSTSEPGAFQLYRLTVRNLGPGSAPGVLLGAETSSIKDLRFVSADPPSLLQEDWVNWAAGELGPGEETSFDVVAELGGPAAVGTLTARATTSLLPGTIADAAHTTAVLADTVDVAIEALEPEAGDELVLRRFLVSEQSGTSASPGQINVVVEFTAELTPDEAAATSLVAAGFVQPGIPSLFDPAANRWVLSINLHVAVSLPQFVTWSMPPSVTPSDWTARIEATAVNDPNPANDEVSGP